MNVSYSQAAGAYQDALKAAQRILEQAGGAGDMGASPVASTQGGGFLDMVGASLKSAANSGYEGERMATKALSGKADLTDVVTAIASAETALNTVVAVRDKVISAYQDIIKMPI